VALGGVEETRTVLSRYAGCRGLVRCWMIKKAKFGGSKFKLLLYTPDMPLPDLKGDLGIMVRVPKLLGSENSKFNKPSFFLVLPSLIYHRTFCASRHLSTSAESFDGLQERAALLRVRDQLQRPATDLQTGHNSRQAAGKPLTASPNSALEL
jgi:hypothetical protein